MRVGRWPLLVLLILTSSLLSTQPSMAAAFCEGKAATLTGSSGADSLTGTSSADVIVSLGGDDTIYGGGGSDTICAGGGNDKVFGQSGDDHLYGEDGDVDVLLGGAGHDYLDGGVGTGDAAAFLDSPTLVDANLSTSVASSGGYYDTLVSLEGLIGSNYADHLTGDDGHFNYFVGGSGNDTIDGQGGLNAVLFSNAPGSVTVSLSTVPGTAIGEGSDKLTSIQAVVGSSYADTLKGDTGDNLFMGGTGDDALRGGGGADSLVGGDGNDGLYGGAGDDPMAGGLGNDTFVGGPGEDLVSFSSSTTAVTAYLGLPKTASGEGADTLTTVEDLVGTQLDDHLKGNGASNRILGLAGDDTLLGAGGNDSLEGNEGTDSLIGGPGSDFCEGESLRTCESGQATNPLAFAATPEAPGRDTPPPSDAPSSLGKPSPEAAAPSEGSRADPSNLGRTRGEPSGSLAALSADVFVLTIWYEITRINCYQDTRQTFLPVGDSPFGYAVGNAKYWGAALAYWDSTQEKWFWTSVSTGWLYHHFYSWPGVQSGYLWEDANGSTVFQSWANLGTESHYFRWAGNAYFDDGSTTGWYWLGAHDNYSTYSPLTGRYTDNWCYMP